MVEPDLEMELPDLRRYARALTGDQRAGDSLVEETRRLLTNRTESTLEHFSDRTRLFGLIGSLLDSRAFLNFNPESPDSMGRRAVLLTEVFGFSDQDARDALDLAPENYDMLLQAARISPPGLGSARIVILEDQFLTADAEQTLLESLGHVVIGSTATADEAFDLVMLHHPEIVICDVDLGKDEPTGLDFAKSVPDSYNCAFVFVTGHPETLLKGHPGEPAYLVAKPYSDVVLGAMVYQAFLAVRAREMKMSGTTASRRS